MSLFRVPLAEDFAGPVIFISDLHLGTHAPGTARRFATLCSALIEKARQEPLALIVLGDFFEYWVGDDVADDLFTQRIVAQLGALHEAGIPLFLMRGNRDFLLGKRFAARAGLTVLPDPCVLEVHGRRIVLTHGDALCSADVGYQRYRRWVHKAWLQRLFLGLPRTLRTWIAQRLRRRSEARHRRSVSAHMLPMVYDVSSQAIDLLFAQSDTSIMVHGHTHRPALHREARGMRYVLPDWDFDVADVRQARGHLLVLDAAGLREQALPTDRADRAHRV